MFESNCIFRGFVAQLIKHVYLRFRHLGAFPGQSYPSILGVMHVDLLTNYSLSISLRYVIGSTPAPLSTS